MTRSAALGRRRPRRLPLDLAAGRAGQRLPAVHPAAAGRRARPVRHGLADGIIQPHLAATLRRGRARLRRRGRIGARRRLCARAQRRLRTAPLALPRRPPGDADPRPRAAHRAVVRARAAGKVVICALIVFFPVAIATMVGIRSVDARLLELGRSLRATRRQVLTTLEIPAALPEHPRWHARRGDARRRRRDRRRVGGRGQGPRRAHQPRPGLALRHPADVRHAPDDRPRRDRPLPRSSSLIERRLVGVR